MNSHIISAAAGTGKTYQLALRYIALLLCGVSPEKLIAITFTRKAAGEFKDRILSQLAFLSKNDGDPKQVAARERDIKAIKKLINSTTPPLGLLPGVELKDSSFMPEHFNDILKNVVTNLTRLNLNTNDSLFSKLNKAFSYELGNSGFTIMSTHEEKRARQASLLSLARLCMANKKEEEVFQEILDNASIANNPEESLLNQVGVLHHLFMRSNSSVWGNFYAFGLGDSDLSPSLNEEDYQVLLSQMIGEAENDTYANFLRSFIPVPQKGKIILLNSKGNPDSGAMIRDKLDAMEKKAQINSTHAECLDKILQSALAYCWGKSLEETKSSARLLEKYDKEYDSLIRGRGKYLFDDVTRQLASMSLLSDTQEILRYRLFCRWEHWLLDEFQDTSREQWQVLEPFIDDVYESNDAGSIFFVGDPKQSIYGWRGGDPEIFNSLSELYPSIIKRDLTESYRSTEGVLGLANAIFDRTNRGNAIGYIKHTSAKKTSFADSGCSQIWQCCDSDDKEHSVCRAVMSIINEVGIKKRTIAILVRSNEEGKKLAGWLKSEGIAAEVSDDVQIGQDSPLMKNVLNFFTWLLHPGDKRNEILLKRSLLWKVISDLSWEDWKKRIENKGYSAFLEYVRIKISLAPSYQLRRLDSIIPFASEADDEGMPLHDWVLYLKELRRRTNPPSNVVQIMTIHKSKGLGFDVVIIPQMSVGKAFADSRRHPFMVKLDEQGGVQGVLKAGNKCVMEFSGHLSEYRNDWEKTQNREGYCLLYVALTRAKEATYVVLQHKKESKKDVIEDSKEGLFSILRQTTDENIDSPVKEGFGVLGAACRYSYGNVTWYQDESEGISPISDKNYSEPEWPSMKPRFVERKSPSRLDEEKWMGAILPSGGKLFDLSIKEALNFGTEVHAVFERIACWDEDNIPQWARLPSTPAEHTVAACMKTPEIRALFEVKDGEVILNEQNIDSWQDEGSCAEWASGTIDRLVIDGQRAHIIDYKTDRVNEASLLVERHGRQLASYRDMLGMALAMNPDDIRCSIISTHLKKVIKLF